MRFAWVHAVAMGFVSIAQAAACAAPEGGTYDPELRRNPPATPGKKTTGAKCATDDECSDGSCVDIEGIAICAKPYNGDDECEGGKCVSLPSCDDDDGDDDDDGEPQGPGICFSP